MKKISFLVLVYFLTTAGFFKSALEDCADEGFRHNNAFPLVETEWVAHSKEEVDKNRVKLDKINQQKLKKHYSLPICKKISDVRSFPKTCRNPEGQGGKLTYEQVLDNKRQFDLSVGKRVVVKEYTKAEIEKKYKKFLNKSTKLKMKNNLYYGQYEMCVGYKKRSPELFKAKYD